MSSWKRMTNNYVYSELIETLLDDKKKTADKASKPEQKTIATTSDPVPQTNKQKNDQRKRKQSKPTPAPKEAPKKKKKKIDQAVTKKNFAS